VLLLLLKFIFFNGQLFTSLIYSMCSTFNTSTKYLLLLADLLLMLDSKQTLIGFGLLGRFPDDRGATPVTSGGRRGETQVRLLNGQVVLLGRQLFFRGRFILVRIGLIGIVGHLVLR
jgi:hypothetical protein